MSLESDVRSDILHIPSCVALAVVGSVELTDDVSRRVVAFILETKAPTVVISGGAPGIDTLAEEEAVRLGIKTDIKRARIKRWGGPGGFRERNLLVARDCAALVRIPWRFTRTYGSGWTRDRARELGKPVAEIILPQDF